MTTTDLSTPRGDAETVRAIVAWLRSEYQRMALQDQWDRWNRGNIAARREIADAIELGAPFKETPQ